MVDDPQAWHAPLGGTAPEDVGPDHLRVGWLLWIRQQPTGQSQPGPTTGC
jgi:hypothetical protein